jgi:membrane protein YdbS with pleckstrin-like domain
MEKDLSKELKKQKSVVTLCAVGLVVSILFGVFFYLQNDKSFWTFVAILVLDLIELPLEIKKYRKLKAEAEE